MTDRAGVLAWLSSRKPAAPEGFALHLAGAASGGAGSLADALAATGVELLHRVVAAPAGGRELALDLLAADAYVTYAFEAQAEDDVDGLTRLADRLTRGGDLG